MPDPVDYLGAPKIITGTDYMHALAALGYNVENLSSPIPTMTKIASDQTNFLDTLYKQNMAGQQAAADLQYKLAETKNVNAIADWNSRSLDLRLAGLKDQNDQSEQQMRFAEQAQPFKQKALETQATLNDLAVQFEQRKSADTTQAQNQFAAALPKLPDPNTDPDFDNNFKKWQTDNAAILAREDSIGQQARLARDNVRNSYQATSRYHQRVADATEFEAYQGKGTISKGYDFDRLQSQNPGEVQNQLVQARALDAQGELNELLVDPRIPQAYRDKLNDAFNYVHNLVSSDTGAQDIQKGKGSLYFNPDGKLNSTARAMVDAVKAVREAKPPEVTARIPIPGVTGKILKGEEPTEEIKGTQADVQQQVQALRAQQAAEVQRKTEMADVPDTAENVADKAAHQRGEISLEELHRRVNARMKATTLPGNRRIPGMRTGGLVRARGFQPGGVVSGAPGTDQVPAMLTSGEFVVNKDAVQDVGLPALAALNAGYGGTQPSTDLALSSGYTGAQPGGTQEDVQFQQPQQPSAFQSLFGQTASQDSTPPIRTTPVVSNLPTIRPQLTQASAPRAMPVQTTTGETSAPRGAMPAQTPAVTTGPATSPISSTGGTALLPQYTTGDFALNAHYLGDGRLSGLATNFGHDVNGRPDTYMLSKLGGGSRIGAFGTDVVNPTTAGVSLPVQTVRAFIGNERDPAVRQRIKSGQVQVEVTAPNGRTGTFPIVDLGPGSGEHASLDVTGTAMRELGMKDNFGAVYRIVSM